MLDPQENWWAQDQVVNKPATPPAPPAYIPGPPDPAKDANAQIKAAEAQYASEKARAEAAKASAEAQTAQAKAADSNPLAREQQRIQNDLAADEMLLKINRARDQIGEGWSTGNVMGTETFQSVPWLGQKSANLHATLEGITGGIINDTIAQLKAQSANGSSGYGALSETEAQRLAAAVGSLHQTQDAESLRVNLAEIEKHYRIAKALLNNEDPRSPEVQKKYGVLSATPPAAVGTTPPPSTPPGGAPRAGGTPPPGTPPVDPDAHIRPQADDTLQGEIATGDTKSQDNPVLAGISKHVADMIGAGRSADQVREYLKSAGIDPSTVQNIDAWTDYIRQHPLYKGPIYINLHTKDVPNDGNSTVLSIYNAITGNNLPTKSKDIGTFAKTQAGTALIEAGNAVTGFQLPKLADNPEQARAALGTLERQNPGAALTGTVLGAGVATGALEAGLTRAGVTRGAPIAADAIYGGVAGNGLDPEGGVGAVLGGALSSAAGGLAGRSVMKGAGELVSPTASAVDEFTPSPGQKYGGALNRAEEIFQDIPIAGAPVRRMRENARENFERGAFNSALREIDDKLPDDMPLGTQPHAYMQQKFNEAYDKARSQMQFVPDQQYMNDLQAYASRIRNGVLNDAQRAQVENILNNSVASRIKTQGGSLTGDAYKQAASEIEAAARQLSGSEPLIADALRDYGSIFDAAARRASPKGAGELLDKADRGYAKAVRIEKAASARGGDTGRFTPNQFDRAVQQASGGTRSRAYLRGDALMGDYAEAGKALSDRVPNSGTPERGLTIAALTGGVGMLSPKALAAPLALSLPYRYPLRNITEAVLTPRTGLTPASQAALRIGTGLRRGAALAGPAASVLALEHTAGD